MFGSILAISNEDLVLSIVCSVIVIVMFVLFYNKIFAVTFDESFSKATGVKSGVYNTIIALLTALTVVVGMRIMGALLISSLIIFPALTSMRVFKSFRGVTVCSAVVACVSFIIGMEITYHADFPAGASVVVANLGMLIIFSLIGLIVRKRNQYTEYNIKSLRRTTLLRLCFTFQVKIILFSAVLQVPNNTAETLPQRTLKNTDCGY